VVRRTVVGGGGTGSVRPGQDLERAQELSEGVPGRVLVPAPAVVRCVATSACRYLQRPELASSRPVGVAVLLTPRCGRFVGPAAVPMAR
jgi:hypothetical protein